MKALEEKSWGEFVYTEELPKGMVIGIANTLYIGTHKKHEGEGN